MSITQARVTSHPRIPAGAYGSTPPPVGLPHSATSPWRARASRLCLLVQPVDGR